LSRRGSGIDRQIGLPRPIAVSANELESLLANNVIS